MKAKDIAGQRFGRLVALEPTEKRYCGHIIWLCRCDCGKIVNVNNCSLLSGGTESCGCLKAKDITGQRFGRLVAIEPTSERLGTSVKWLCQCDCGKAKIISLNALRRRGTISCGHVSREQASIRGVAMWGERNSAHKLTAEQVNDIRHRYAAGFVTQLELAEKFGVAQSRISHIVRGESWKNLPGGPVTRMFPVTRAPRIRQSRRIKQRNEGVSMSKK